MNRSGFVYVAALAVVVFLITIGSSLLLRSLNEFNLSARYSNLSGAFHLAESGLDEAINQIRASQFESIDGNLMTGTYSATITQLDSTHYQITAGGVATGESRQLEAVVSFIPSSMYDYAVQAVSTVELDSNSKINSYDSRDGNYGGSNVLNNGDVATNGTGSGIVNLESNADVYGDVYIGPGGNTSTDVTLKGNSEIHGSSYAMMSAMDMTPETFPGGGASSYLELSSNQTQSLSAGTYSYTHVDLSSNSKVNVTGDVTLYVEDYFILSSNAKFQTDCDSCSITLYIEGGNDPELIALGLNSNSQLTAGNDPMRLTVHVTGTGGSAAGAVEFDSNTKVYGVVDASLSEVEVKSNSHVYGAVIGNAVELDSNAWVHYDEALSTSGGGSGGVTVSLISWRLL